MFYFDFNSNMLYHITRETAKEGLRKVLTAEFNQRFNSNSCKAIVDDIMSKTFIPIEYESDKIIFASADDNLAEGLNFLITATEVIPCKNEKNGSYIMPFPFPKCSIQDIDFTNYVQDNLLVHLAEVNQYFAENGIIKQNGILGNLTFSASKSYNMIIADILEDLLNKECSKEVAAAICSNFVNSEHKLFVHRVVNKNPIIFSVSPDNITSVNIQEKLSAATIKNIIKAHFEKLLEIHGFEEEITELSNKIHNVILYDEECGAEELSNTYIYKDKDGRERFGFEKPPKDIDSDNTFGVSFD